MPKCFNCGGELIWGADFNGDECGYEELGIVHTYSCPKCGAEYTVFEPLDKPKQ